MRLSGGWVRARIACCGFSSPNQFHSASLQQDGDIANSDRSNLSPRKNIRDCPATKGPTQISSPADRIRNAGELASYPWDPVPEAHKNLDEGALV
jgi:hypothetical protein